jgi:hypothetical protein
VLLLPLKVMCVTVPSTAHTRQGGPCSGDGAAALCCLIWWLSKGPVSAAVAAVLCCCWSGLRVHHWRSLAAAPSLWPNAKHSPVTHLPVLVLVCVVLQPSLFGCNDGPGHSLVYYFALPEGWEPSQVRVTPSLPAPRLSPGRRSSVAAELLAGPGPTPALS